MSPRSIALFNYLERGEFHNLLWPSWDGRVRHRHVGHAKDEMGRLLYSCEAVYLNGAQSKWMMVRGGNIVGNTYNRDNFQLLTRFKKTIR